MHITSIKKLKNNLYELVIDDTEKFKLAEDYLIQYHFLKVREITDEEYQILNTLANYSKIYAKTLNYLSYKMRTEGEVINYLKEQKCADALQSAIVEKLKRLNYINDELYCSLYVKQQFESNKKGPKLISQELKDKLVPESLIDRAIDAVTPERVNNNVISIITAYDEANKSQTASVLKNKLLRLLLQKGYDYDVVLNQLSNYQFKDTHHVDLLKKELAKAYNKYQKKYHGYELKTRIIRSLLNKGFSYDAIQEELSEYFLSEE